jgi:hypothetical protein
MGAIKQLGQNLATTVSLTDLHTHSEWSAVACCSSVACLLQRMGLIEHNPTHDRTIPSPFLL